MQLAVNNEKWPVKKCKTCKNVRPPRSFHCKVCDVCVEVHDHHCPWMATCVGKRNHTAFSTFLMVGALYCIVMTLVLVWKMVEDPLWKEEDWGSTWVWHVGRIYLLLCALTMGLTLTCFGGSHCFLGWIDLTTNESI